MLTGVAVRSSCRNGGRAASDRIKDRIRSQPGDPWRRSSGHSGRWVVRAGRAVFPGTSRADCGATDATAAAIAGSDVITPC